MGHKEWVVAAAIGIVAFAAVDVAHEALGHGVAALLSSGVSILSISTVALSTDATNPWIALAGPALNVVLGVVTMIWFRRGAGFGPGAFFVWLFGVVNLLNGFGYGVYSGVLDFGDLAAATRGLEPHVAWRIGMGMVGALGYYASLRVAAAALAQRLRASGISAGSLPSLLWPAYLAGSVLFVLGAALNPIPSLVLLSGVSGGFVCMAGLPAIAAMVQDDGLPIGATIGRATAWLVGALVVLLVFVGVLGPGVRFGGHESIGSGTSTARAPK
ncbi:hypothetical protein L2Y96_12125 [Luteibacter aegosomaticola]|uniref:hypothetical protein n=1 Tax=Luteibacter aegosomaticola TaxID=2911538 RepID=UPI001FFA5CFC|nr:hypothetical protein [Luteibacter aegosomaticola]UPG88166.1 hypothetical protein L2Y96_12125 [Luteibacter aegosomaticola]